MKPPCGRWAIPFTSEVNLNGISSSDSGRGGALMAHGGAEPQSCRLRPIEDVRMGEVRDRYGLTARAVRFYEERGLISATRDRWNRRRFDAKACEQLRIIALLRRANLSLCEVADVLARRDRSEAAGCARTALDARRRQLHREIAQVEDVLSELTAPAPNLSDYTPRQTRLGRPPRIEPSLAVKA
jgi:DNA-binding transcriptional MerR regulator